MLGERVRSYEFLASRYTFSGCACKIGSSSPATLQVRLFDRIILNSTTGQEAQELRGILEFTRNNPTLLNFVVDRDGTFAED